MNKTQYCQVAVPTPLRRVFDYQVPEHFPTPKRGARVVVPFGRRKLVGFVMGISDSTEVEGSRLKAVEKIVDDEPLVSDYLFDFYCWVASYYHQPVGEALAAMFPAALRTGKTLSAGEEVVYQLTSLGKGLPESALSRSPKQQLALNILQKQGLVSKEQLTELSVSSAVIKQLLEKQLIESSTREKLVDKPMGSLLAEPALNLNKEQDIAVSSIALKKFTSYLLQGETGSGKTEVYLQLIAKVVEQGKQAIVLIPEISLTPQTVARFKQRFNCQIALMHSGLTDKQRAVAWQQAKSGEAAILIGTRSAIFTPLKSLGLIVVDEEHDSSFKQQDGFHYSARDIAVIRAQKESIPVILGSATPSLESLQNVALKRYQKLTLTEQHGKAQAKRWVLHDIKQQSLRAGFSAPLIKTIEDTLKQGSQVLVFLNRRGYAPKLSCNDCGWIAQCHHCDVRLTVHRQAAKLVCHHCEAIQAIPRQCPECFSKQLTLSGQGTEKSEETLELLFPDTPIHRVDRDTTRRKNAMADLVDKINQNEPCILVGTQMLAKGHHFPNVALVAMLDVDNGLFSPDFRAVEKMGQLIIQVAGRCGRGDKSGTIFIQSHYCDHPIITTLATQGYSVFSQQLMIERELTAMPPFRHMAIIRAEAKNAQQAEGFLQQIKQHMQAVFPASPSLSYIGPLANALERKQGQYRYQLTLLAEQRKLLHQALHQSSYAVENFSNFKGVRWRMDVDPIESI